MVGTLDEGTEPVPGVGVVEGVVLTIVEVEIYSVEI
jgi:hypothetical protein